MPNGPRVPTIAVVAVHGIGEQQPGASARSLADLLLRLRYRNGAARYTSFSGHELRIPVRPAVVEPSQSVAPPPPRSIFSEQSDTLLGRLHGTCDANTLAAEHEFMRGQLEEYESTGAPYETIRIEGARLDGAGDQAEPSVRVHLYEMYWADLSRLGVRPLRVFGEMYQLFFNVANLGRLTVDHARAAYGDPPAWRLFGNLHTWGVRLLTAFVPAAWLTMLATVLGVLVLQAPLRVLPPVIAVGAGLAAAAATWWLIYRIKALARRAPFWFAIPGVGAATGWLLWRAALAEEHPLHLLAMVLTTWMLLAGAALYLTYRQYETVRPGAFMVGMLAYGASLAGSLGVVAHALANGTAEALLRHTAHLFEVQTALTVGIWYVLYAVGALSAIVGLVARRRLRPHVSAAEDARAGRVWWTAQSTLAIAVWSVLVVTFVLWAAVYRIASPLLPAGAAAAPDPLIGFWAADTYAAMFGRMLTVTAGAGFPLALLCAGFLAIVLLVALLPAVIQELRAPPSTDRFAEDARPGEQGRNIEALWHRLAQEDVLSDRLGRWLSVGYAAVIASTAVLFVAVFFLQPLASVVYWVTGESIPVVGPALGWLQEQAGAIILFLGGALTAAALGLVALRSRFQKLALGFRPMLDAALDVDNYMREHPRQSTPRARIAERYASLLRYLGHWRDADGEPYSSIVLVTHSQGTVITADLLGFLQRERDPELAMVQDFAISAHMGVSPENPRRRLFLFTMGSPLRQLYNWCFPHLFGWVHVPESAWGAPSAPGAAASPDAASQDHAGAGARPRRQWQRQSGATPPAEAVGRNDEGHVVVAPAIPPTASPEPSVIGASRWVNAYRSGDYVGRSLWRVDMPDCGWTHRAATADARGIMRGTPPPVIFVSEDERRSRRELCIGRGAHTHYWNDTAASIAIELDLLLDSATPAFASSASGARPAIHPPEGVLARGTSVADRTR